MVETVNLYEAKTHLSKLVDRAAEGEEILIAKNGKVMARLMPVPVQGKRRVPAHGLGLTYIPDNFDDPLPDDILALFNGKP